MLPIFKDTAVSGRYRHVLFYPGSPNLSKKVRSIYFESNTIRESEVRQIEPSPSPSTSYPIRLYRSSWGGVATPMVIKVPSLPLGFLVP